MICVRFERAEGRMLLETTGHAGSGPVGHDIVCAAVSALVQGFYATLCALAESYPNNVTIEADDRNDVTL